MDKIDITTWTPLGWWLYLYRHYVTEETFLRLWKSGDSQAINKYLSMCGRRAQYAWKKELEDMIQAQDEGYKKMLVEDLIPTMINAWFERYNGDVEKVRDEIYNNLKKIITNYNLQDNVNKAYTTARTRYFATAKVDPGQPGSQ